MNRNDKLTIHMEYTLNAIKRGVKVRTSGLSIYRTDTGAAVTSTIAALRLRGLVELQMVGDERIFVLTEKGKNA